MRFQDFIDEHRFIIAEGSVIERIRRDTHYSLDPDIANAAMIYDETGKSILTSIYGGYVETARRFELPILILAPTWRASGERIARAGLKGVDVNRDCAEFMMRLRGRYGPFAERILIGGIMGCRGNAYDPSDAPDAREARDYHSFQAERLARAGVDFLLASTLPSSREAAGMAGAMSCTGLPYILSFVVRGSGELLDGVPMRKAIASIDRAASPPPAYYMLNCVHPDNLRAALTAPCNTARRDDEEPIHGRILGLQANASRMNPEDLDDRAELDADPPDLWARSMISLHEDFGLRVLGGCCGTNESHISGIASLYAGRGASRDGGGPVASNNGPNADDPAVAPDAPIELPIDGTLDLHAFQAREVKDLIPEYLAACRERGIMQVRVIHGKGTGALRETVHAVLERSSLVEEYHQADETGGGWGATIVILKGG